MIQTNFNIEKIKLIVGLGNIGKKYERTRHNAGFLYLDFLKKDNFKEEAKFKAYVSTLINKTNSGKIILAKPTTLMNSSGESVNLIKSFYKIKPEEVIIIHDDLDLELGKFKLQFNKGPKIHNGVLSIENHLGSSNFWRLRIGIDSRSEEERKIISGKDYVLASFSSQEINILNSTFSSILI